MPKHIPYACPFCGSTVTVEAVLEGLLFTCRNIRRCGAVIKFENDHYDEHREDAIKAFSRRCGTDKGGKRHDP